MMSACGCCPELAEDDAYIMQQNFGQKDNLVCLDRKSSGICSQRQRRVREHLKNGFRDWHIPSGEHLDD